MYSVSEPILSADGTTAIISSRNFKDFCSDANLENGYNEIHNKKFITFYIIYWL
jgi:hypothetical protein